MVRSFKDDYLRGLGTGGTLADIPTEQNITQITHGFSVLEPVYYNSGSGLWALAQADDVATLGRRVVVEVINVNMFKIAMVGRYTIAAHGLTETSTYYVSPTVAGALTRTMPNPSAGEILNPLVRTIDANTILVVPYEVGGEEKYFTINSYIRSGENEIMHVVYRSAFNFNVLGLDYQCMAGTIDLTVQANSVNVPGLTGLTISNADTTVVATPPYVCPVNQNVIYTFTNNSNAAGIILNLRCMRNTML